MDPGVALIVAGCVLVPAAVALVLRRRGMTLAAAGLVAVLALAGLGLLVAARQAEGMDGMGYMVMAIGALLATGGAVVGLVAGALWRR